MTGERDGPCCVSIDEKPAQKGIGTDTGTAITATIGPWSKEKHVGEAALLEDGEEGSNHNNIADGVRTSPEEFRRRRRELILSTPIDGV